MAARRRTGVRWDRVGRVALVCTLVAILLLYISPAKRWLEQSTTASRQEERLRELERERRELRHQVRSLRSPGALEREARRLGMMAQGERSFVVRGLPGR